MKNIFYESEYSPYAWWMSSCKNTFKNTLVMGKLDYDDLMILSDRSENIYITHDQNHPKTAENVSALTPDVISNNEYDCIIINTFQSEVPASTIDTLFKVISSSNTVYSLVWLRHANQYNSMLRKYKHDNHLIESFSSTCSDSLPEEAFKSGYYFSNKNINLIKQKIKRYIFNSYLKKYFIRCQVTYIYPENIYHSIYDDVIEEARKHLKSGSQDTSTELLLTQIYYKYGKNILTLVNHKTGKRYVIVIALDKEARLQRNNELETISYLRTTDLSRYIVDEYVSFTVNDMKCYLMDEVPGITIDLNCKNIDNLLLSAFNVLIDLSCSEKSLEWSTNVKESKLDHYLDRINNKLGEHINLDEYVFFDRRYLDSNIPSVLVHGDLKIENFVFNENYAITKIIDWELGDTNGFPLIDLIYLIIYNMKIVDNINFYSAYLRILNNDLREPYLTMISEYARAINLSHEQILFLKCVFILHHYAYRESIKNPSQEKITNITNIFEHISNTVTSTNNG